MKRFLLILMCTLLVVCIHADSTSTAKQNKADINSLYTPAGTDKYLGSIYEQGKDYIKTGQTKKAYQHFRRIVKNKNTTKIEKEHAYYQLAHYKYYGYFDLYYNGIPSNIDRSVSRHLRNKKGKADLFFQSANTKTYMLMVGNPQLSSYNPIKLMDPQVLLYNNPINLIYGCTDMLESSNVEDKRFAEIIFDAAFPQDSINDIDLLKSYSTIKNCNAYSIIESDDLDRIISFSKALPYLSRMKQPEYSDIGKTASELNTLGKQAEEIGMLIDAFYYYTRAALFGNAEAFVRMFIVADKHNDNIYQKHIGYWAQLQGDFFEYKMSLAKKALECKVFSQYNRKFLESYIATLQEQKYMYYQKKEDRTQRAAQFLENVLMGVGEALAMSTNPSYNPYMSSTPNYNTAGMNDAARVAQWNAELNQLMTQTMHQTIQQTQAQDYATYQAMREHSQRMGQDLTYEEYNIIKGQAFQQLQNEGNNILAEQTTDERIQNTNNQQHVQTGTTSSGDYQFVKYINLYKRVDTSNKLMFSNQELYQKGGNYYVKIDNTYFFVLTGGRWGFNSCIEYGYSLLYFDL